jgi:hypothetical protein
LYNFPHENTQAISLDGDPRGDASSLHSDGYACSGDTATADSTAKSHRNEHIPLAYRAASHQYHSPNGY